MNIQGWLAMLFGSREAERKPDPLRANLTIALQANERASENVRRALEDMLEASDAVRGVLVKASEKIRNRSQ